MKWISFNCRGLASHAKKLALRILLDIELIDIIYLQEALGMDDQVISSLNSLMSGWIFHDLDVNGKYGGIALGINPNSIKMISSWGGARFIGMGIYSLELVWILEISIFMPPILTRMII